MGRHGRPHPATRKHMNVFVGGERAGLETPLGPGAEVYVRRAIRGSPGGENSTLGPGTGFDGIRRICCHSAWFGKAREQLLDGKSTLTRTGLIQSYYFSEELGEMLPFQLGAN